MTLGITFFGRAWPELLWLSLWGYVMYPRILAKFHERADAGFFELPWTWRILFWGILWLDEFLTFWWD
jgi:hypothetical protein